MKKNLILFLIYKINNKNPILDSQTKKIKHPKKKFNEKKSNFIPNISTEIKINLTNSK